MLARKFLYIVAVLIVLTLGSSLAYRMWGQQMLTAVMVPSAPFRDPAPLSVADYERRDLWIARPDIEQGNGSLWLPKGAWRPKVPGTAAIFSSIRPAIWRRSTRRAGTPRWRIVKA